VPPYHQLVATAPQTTRADCRPPARRKKWMRHRHWYRGLPSRMLVQIPPRTRRRTMSRTESRPTSQKICNVLSA
jgi:hypothetical protein